MSVPSLVELGAAHPHVDLTPWTWSFTLSRTAVDSRKKKRAQTINLSFESHVSRGELSEFAEIGDQGDFVICALDCVSPTDQE